MLSILFHTTVVLSVVSFGGFITTLAQQQMAASFLMASIVLFFLSFVLNNFRQPVER